jgi:hypothetical protein
MKLDVPWALNHNFAMFILNHKRTHTAKLWVKSHKPSSRWALAQWGRWDLNPHDRLRSTDFHPLAAFATAVEHLSKQL